MSRLADSFDPNGIGILILRHNGYNALGAGSYDLALRGGIKAAGVLDRDDNKGGLGSWTRDENSAGDLDLAYLWQNDPKKRSIPGWGFAWPVVVQGSKDVATKSGNQGTCGISPEKTSVNPIKDKDYTADDRFKTLELPSIPKRDGLRVWPKFPIDWIGLSTTTTEEHKQTELLLSCDPRTVAVQAGGDAEMGSLMGDVGPDFRIDPKRLARYQSAFWVVKNPKGCVDFFGRNSIAINLGPSRCRDVRGGLVIDEPFSSGTATTDENARAIGVMSAHATGPLDVGGLKDIHRIGTDADGRPINAAHASTSMLFRRNEIEDGPLNFTTFKKGQDFQKTARVYLGFNTSIPHDFVCGSRIGKWDWWTTVPDYIVTPPTRTPPFDPVRPTITNPAQGPPVQTAGSVPKLAPASVAGILQPYLARVSDSAFCSILARPQFIQNGVPDFRKTVNGVPDSMMQANDETAPIVGRIEPWGKQSGSMWAYTDRPNYSRFVGGTANGGWTVMPPEVDMADQGTSFSPGPSRSQSTTTFSVLSGSYFAAGLPDITTGQIKTGYRWTADTTGNLNLDAVNSSGVATAKVLQLSSDRRVKALMGTSTSLAPVVTTADVELTVTGTDANTTEKTLQSYSLAANALDANGKGLRIKAWGTTAANANTKTIRLKFGATTIATNDITTAPNGVTWEMDATLFRTSSGNQESIGEGWAGAVAQSKSSTQPRETDTGAITIALTGQNSTAAANDIVCRGMVTEMMT